MHVIQPCGGSFDVCQRVAHVPRSESRYTGFARSRCGYLGNKLRFSCSYIWLGITIRVVHLVEDIEVTEVNRFQAVGAGEDVVIEFVGQFEDCERGERLHNFVRLGQVWVAAIGGITGGAFDASIAGGMSMSRKPPVVLWLVAMMNVNYSKGLSCFPNLSRFAAAASRGSKQTNSQAWGRWSVASTAAPNCKSSAARNV